MAARDFFHPISKEPSLPVWKIYHLIVFGTLIPNFTRTNEGFLL
jgi:hypothetical protein